MFLRKGNGKPVEFVKGFVAMNIKATQIGRMVILTLAWLMP